MGERPLGRALKKRPSEPRFAGRPEFTTVIAFTPEFERSPRFDSIPDDLSYRRAEFFVLRL